MMKKYLMTGMAAVAICAAFTSCSKSENLYDEAAVKENQTQQKIENVEKAYAAAFEKAFGKVASTVDWGFSSKASTRAINVNGNLWKETPECTEAEAKLVFDYVNMTRAQMTAAGHKYTEIFPKNIANYFVTQVWTGTDTYSTFDGTSTGILGSSKMNHLNIAMKEDAKLVDGVLTGAESSWEHINNFNAGSNMNYGGNTLVVDGGTLDFTYHNSEDSRYHNKWIAINGADVDASLAGKYYICFDFKADNPGAYTQFRFKVPGNNPGELIEKGPVSVPGCWTVESATAANLQGTYSEWVWNGSTSVEEKKTITIGGEGTTDWSIDNVVGGNRVIPANDVYTDWIVRIVEAEPDNETHLYRVIAEDLNATESSDFDFNDVVFDVVKAEKGKTTLKLIAAGGIYKLTVAGVEVHEKLGESVKTDGTYPMINTGAGSTKEPVEFDIDGTYTTPEQIKNIIIKVYKPGFEENGIELKAQTGEPACKILVDDTFGVVKERQDISNEYKKFTNYVTGSFDGDFWWK